VAGEFWVYEGGKEGEKQEEAGRAEQDDNQEGEY
jgi:hypothetical protein